MSGSRHLLIAMTLLIIVIGVQFRAGAYEHAMTTGADDPAHFVSGLMVHDYLGHGLTTPPMPYAREYYAHYPKVAIGNWPPGFPAMQAVWMLVFPTSVHSVLALVALMATATAWMVFWLLQRTMPATFAMFGAASYLLLPPVGTYFSMIMAEIPLTMIGTAAVCMWVRFLTTERSRDLGLFAFFAALAVMTRVNGLLLFLLPAFSIVIGRRWRLLRHPLLWKSMLTLAVFAGAWVLHYLPVMRGGWPKPEQWFTAFSNPFFYPRELHAAIGTTVVVVAIIGAWFRLRDLRRPSSGVSGTWLAAAATILSVLLFNLLVPGGLAELRHALPAYPFIAMFLAAGVHTLSSLLSSRLPATGGAFASGVSVAAMIMLLVWRTRTMQIAPLDGFEHAAAVLTERHEPRDSAIVTLISSDAAGEGAFVAQVALKDKQRPSHTVWRASKLLASARWSGAEYRLRSTSPAGVLALLDSAGVSSVVLDGSTRALPHEALIARTVNEFANRFVLLRSSPVRRGRDSVPDGIRVYRYIRDPGFKGSALLRQTPGRPGVEFVRGGGGVGER